MAKKRKGLGCMVFGFVSAVLVTGGLAYFSAKILPTRSRPPEFVRFAKPIRLNSALKILEERGVIKDALVAGIYAKFTGKGFDVKTGTFRVKAGSTIDDILAALHKNYRQMVRLPEGWWQARMAERLEEKEVCKAEEYMAAVSDPSKYSDLGLKLPKDSLEGWLFPDTYDLAPLTPPEDIVRLQLKTFKRKVVDKLPKNTNLQRALIIASIVDLEAAKDVERPRIAGVIENRLRKGQPLEIDATVLFALQEWKSLDRGVVRTVHSPYNTYLNKGLPPGPIGSPGLKSILAALSPEKHEYLYYVARFNQSHYFASTYPEHLQNIRKARSEGRMSGSRT